MKNISKRRTNWFASRLTPGNLKNIFADPLKLFLCLSVIFGVAYACVNPPFFGLDERAHYLRSYEVAQGRLAPTEIGADHHPGAYLPENLTRLVYVTTGNLSTIVNHPSPNPIKKDYAQWSLYTPYFHQQFSQKQADDSVSDNQISGTYAYNPIGYTALAIGVRAGQTLHLPVLANIYLTRLVALATFIVIAAYAIKVIPRFKWLVAVAALLPVTLFQAATVSVDGIITAAALLLFALYIRLHDGEGGAFYRGLALAALIFLSLTKPPYVLFVLPFLFLRSSLFKNASRAYTWKAAWIAGPLLAAGLWQIVNRKVLQDVLAAYTVADPQGQSAFMLHHPLHFVGVLVRTYYAYADLLFGQMTGRMGNESIGLPLAIIACLLGVAGIAALMSAKDENKPAQAAFTRVERGVLAVTALGIILGISVSLYLIYCSVGTNLIGGLQGRYFIPVLPIIFFLLAPALPYKVVGDRLVLGRTIGYTMTGFLLFSGIVYLLANI